MNESKLKPVHATREIQRRAKTGGELRLTPEVIRDMSNPRDWGHTVTLDEVNECLKSGRVNADPEYDDKHDEWRYRVELSTASYKLITVTVILSEGNGLRVITRFKKKQSYNRAKRN